MHLPTRHLPSIIIVPILHITHYSSKLPVTNPALKIQRWGMPYHHTEPYTKKHGSTNRTLVPCLTFLLPHTCKQLFQKQLLLLCTVGLLDHIRQQQPLQFLLGVLGVCLGDDDVVDTAGR